jgi:carotenoid cleavage dioxygenase-like enzyme
LGKEYRHGWYASPDGELASNMESNDSYFNTVGHYDHASDKVDRYSFGQSSTSEALFVPKSADSAEGEGYLLAVTTSFETHTSSLCILDALNLSKGPLAKVHLSHCVPSGFHGAWRNAS